MRDILVVTMGMTWQIVPELLGFTNPGLGYYSEHPRLSEIEELRGEYCLGEVSEVWVISTGGARTDESVLSLKRWSDVSGFPVRVFRIGGVEELSSVEECRYMADYIYRVVLAASECDGELYLSLAGGRKTMSAEMQQAGNLFGCSAMLHVVDRSLDKDSRLRFNGLMFDGAVPGDLAGAVMPLVVFGRKDRDDLLDAGVRIVSGDYPVSEEGECCDELWREVQRQLFEAKNLLCSHYLELSGGCQQTNFRGLYSLSPSLIEKLKSTACTHGFAHVLPKAELHCHFGGIASPCEMVEIALTNAEGVDAAKAMVPEFGEFLGRVGGIVGSGDMVGLKRLVPDVRDLRGRVFPGVAEPFGVCGFLMCFCDCPEFLEEYIYGDVPGDGMGIEAYERLGDLQGSGLLQSEGSIRAAARVLLRKCREHNVKYIEVRCSPVNYTRGGLSPVRVVELMMEEFGKGSSVVVKLVFIASRHRRMSEIYSHVELVEELLGIGKGFEEYFVGFDLAGAEGIREPSELRHAFLPLMRQCVSLTIHAGETEDSGSVWEAVYHLNADRIGHGLSLKDDPDLMSRLRDRRITVELCPSSNRQIVGVGSGYPLKDYLEKGLRVTVNTDNPGISRTDFTREYVVAGELCGRALSEWDVLQLIRNSYRGAFAAYDLRQRLLLEAEAEILGHVIGL